MRTWPMLILFWGGCTTWNMAKQVPGATGAPSGGGVATGLPCDVDQLLADNCRACHGAVPSGGAPMSLITYADLMAPAVSDPTMRVADVCLMRMMDPTAPMPPTPPAVPAAELAAFQAWLAAGAPMGDCVAAGDPLSAAPTCTSGRSWNGGDDGSSRMNPGMACISCHAQRGEDAPRFTIAGTVYPTGHEPDLCDGSAGAQVVITGADGHALTLTPNPAGNFSSSAGVVLPYHAAVVANGRTRAMAAAQTSGDCNGCHTQSGANGAPGRITLP